MDWTANWIWVPGESLSPNSYMYARREFDWQPNGELSAFVSCSSDYRLYVNGRYVGRGPGACIPAAQYYDEYGLGHLLRPGRNVIAALCYNSGVDTATRPRSPGGFLFQMGSAAGVALVTDESWRVLPGAEWDRDTPRMSPTLEFAESYNSLLKPVGWNVVGLDDSHWLQPEVLGGVGTEPWSEMIPRSIPHLREHEVFAESVVSCGWITGAAAELVDGGRICDEPAAMRYCDCLLDGSAEAAIVQPGNNAFVVLDFGRLVTGRPAIRIRDGGGCRVDISCSPGVGTDGRLTTPCGVRQVDTVLMHGGRQEWHSFGRRCFRYVQVVFRDVVEPVQVESLSARTCGYPVEQVSEFECSDDLLNRAWRTGADALAVTMHDSYEACPLCDPEQHASIARLAALANYYCFSDTSLAAKALDQLARSLPHDGTSLDERFAWLLMLHDYCAWTGDLELARRHYPQLRALLDGQVPASVLISGDSDACATTNAFYYRVLRDAARLAGALSEHEDSRGWHSRAEQLFAAFNQCYWDHEAGAYASGAGEPAQWTASVLAVLFGLADADRATRVSAALPDALQAEDKRASFYALEALAKMEMSGAALDCIRGHWGATTGSTSCAGSPCCGDSSAPTYFLPAEILGVKPSTLASDVVVVQPRPAGLAWARGSVRMRGGVAQVEWHNEPGRFVLEVDAPQGFIVALPVSQFIDPVIEELDQSPEADILRVRRTYGWGSVVWQDGEERDPYLDWLETQQSDPPPEYRPRWRLRMEGAFIWVRETPSTRVRYEIRESEDTLDPI